MKRDGRSLGHETLEEMRKLAVQRMNEGERPAVVAASFGMHRSWAFKCRAAAKGKGKGLRALKSTKASGRPRKLSAAQQRQVFRWINGKNPQQYGFDFGLWTRQIVQSLVLCVFRPNVTTDFGIVTGRSGHRDRAAVSAHRDRRFGAP